MSKTLILLVDIVSPFAYLAFELVTRSPVFGNVDVKCVPVLLGGIMKATGNSPPINIKSKGSWLMKDRMRWSKLFDIPLAENMPSGFPWNTVQLQRALVATEMVKPDGLFAAVKELYRLAWVESQEVHRLEHFKPVFTGLFGVDVAQQILDKATTEEVKAALTKNTQDALESGCFGLPWFIATNDQGETEGFWGFDHIGQVADFLGTERPKPSSERESGWKAML